MQQSETVRVQLKTTNTILNDQASQPSHILRPVIVPSLAQHGRSYQVRPSILRLDILIGQSRSVGHAVYRGLVLSDTRVSSA